MNQAGVGVFSNRCPYLIIQYEVAMHKKAVMDCIPIIAATHDMPEIAVFCARLLNW